MGDDFSLNVEISCCSYLGAASGYYGRKWSFIINLAIFVVLEIDTGFVKTYKELLAVRALFGIAMVGMYGNAAVTAIENQPLEQDQFYQAYFCLPIILDLLLLLYTLEPLKIHTNQAKGGDRYFGFVQAYQLL